MHSEHVELKIDEREMSIVLNILETPLLWHFDVDTDLPHINGKCPQANSKQTRKQYDKNLYESAVHRDVIVHVHKAI